MNNKRQHEEQECLTDGLWALLLREIESKHAHAMILAGLLLSVPVSARADPASHLFAALSSASGGDTIVLADGHYGDLTLAAWQSFPSNVTIQAANPLGASFDTVKINASNVTLDGLAFNERLTIQNADSVTVSNGRLSGWNEALFSSNVTFEGNESRGTISIEETTGFRVADNYIHEIAGDLMRVIGNSSDGVVENNVLWDMIPERFADGSYIHADALQMFTTSKGTPHDIVIRGNSIYDDYDTLTDPYGGGYLAGQGIFLGGPTGGYRNITIEENLVATNSPNAIYMSTGVEGNVIRNNTVLGSGTIIAKTGDSSGTEIYNNVVKSIIAENGSTAFDNFFYSDVSALFQNGGDGSTWQDFLPKDGSPIDFGSGYGALQRLAELLER